ncbi:MAG TPA: hypothetical protein VJ787_14775 [Thermoleophilia bacterium]|nr:hypothetical protein [Thermoleophilia bacterium]
MAGWFRSILGAPQPSGPSETVRRFGTADPTLSQGCVTVEQEGWVIDPGEGQTVRLFEVADPQAEACLLAYRARIRSEGLTGRVYLEMWCRVPGRGEFFSKGVDQPVKGTTDWSSCEIPFYLKKGQRPDLIKLNLVVEGRGRVWIKDVELLKTALGERG